MESTYPLDAPTKTTEGSGETRGWWVNRYFLKADWQNEYQEVTEEQFITAERAAGFRPKYGDGVATGGFSGRGVSGRVEYVEDK